MRSNMATRFKEYNDIFTIMLKKDLKNVDR